MEKQDFYILLSSLFFCQALLLIFSLCFLSAEVWRMLRERAQYLTQGWRLFQLLVALLSFSAASVRFCFLSTSAACLSVHVSQPDTFTGFHSVAALAKSSSQLSAVLLMLLVPQVNLTAWTGKCLLLQAVQMAVIDISVEKPVEHFTGVKLLKEYSTSTKDALHRQL